MVRRGGPSWVALLGLLSLAAAAEAAECGARGAACSAPQDTAADTAALLQTPRGGAPHPHGGKAEAGEASGVDSGDRKNEHIAIVSVCIPGDPAFSALCRVSNENTEKYARYHGYSLFLYNQTFNSTSARSPHWNKILALKKVLAKPEIEFAFWKDADSLFMNMVEPLDGVLPPPSYDMTIVGDDAAFLNDGHFVMRNTPWSKDMLDRVWSVYPPPKWWHDQSSFIYVLSGSLPECRSCINKCRFAKPTWPEVHVLPQRAMNSYIGNYVPGDLILHFAGFPDKPHWMEKYAMQADATSSGLESLVYFHRRMLTSLIMITNLNEVSQGSAC